MVYLTEQSLFSRVKIKLLPSVDIPNTGILSFPASSRTRLIKAGVKTSANSVGCNS